MAVELPTVAHNEALAGDTLTTLTLNYQWRRWVAIAIYTELRRQFKSDVESEQDQLNTWIDALIDDLYNAEVQEDMTPVGTIASFVAQNPPSKWLPMDGQSHERDTYPDLWNITPSAWHLVGVGENPDLIVLPDMTQLFIYGTNTQAEIGDTGGEAEHTLTIAEIPAHSHTIFKNNVSGTAIQRALTAGNVSTGDQNTSSVGGDGAHNNLPPFIRLVWMIKALP